MRTMLTLQHTVLAVLSTVAVGAGFLISSAVAADNASKHESSKARVMAEKPEKTSKHSTNGEQQMPEIYTFKAKSIDGKDITLDQYKGDVLLIVNTASKCGFTPQYAGLEELHKKYADKGLKILGFPCNQFGEQEPGDHDAIASFCQRNYGVDFQMFDKIDVNGKNAHPLYKYLTSAAPGALGTEAIKWNFTKFLVDRQGNVIKRFAPTVVPADIAPDIEAQLKK